VCGSNHDPERSDIFTVEISALEILSEIIVPCSINIFKCTKIISLSHPLNIFLIVMHRKYTRIVFVAILKLEDLEAKISDDLLQW